MHEHSREDVRKAIEGGAAKRFWEWCETKFGSYVLRERARVECTLLLQGGVWECWNTECREVRNITTTTCIAENRQD